MKRTMTLINQTDFNDNQLEEISLGLLVGQLAPSFYLICVKKSVFRGVALTNLDKPTVIVCFDNLTEFAETFVHELVHLQQHANNYADENAAYSKMREVVVTK